MVRTHPDPPNVRDNRRMAALSHRLHTKAYAARCSVLPCLVLANSCGVINGGGLAQLGEHLLCKQGVVGSIPSSSTNDAGGQCAGTRNQASR